MTPYGKEIELDMSWEPRILLHHPGYDTQVNTDYKDNPAKQKLPKNGRKFVSFDGHDWYYSPTAREAMRLVQISDNHIDRLTHRFTASANFSIWYIVPIGLYKKDKILGQYPQVIAEVERLMEEYDECPSVKIALNYAP